MSIGCFVELNEINIFKTVRSRNKFQKDELQRRYFFNKIISFLSNFRSKFKYL